MTDVRNVPVEDASTPSSLLAGLRERSVHAWTRMARLYVPVVYQWCRNRGLQAADAEDVAQEVFGTVAARIDGFRKERRGDTFRGWLWTITRHKLGDYIRRQGRDAAVTSGALDEMPAAAAPATPPSCGLFRHLLDRLRGQFKETTWQAFWSVVVEDRAPEDVAATLGVPVNVVYLAKSRVLRRLREEAGEVE